MRPFKKVGVVYNDGRFIIVEWVEKPTKVEHPCLTNFNADEIDPDILGTELDHLLEPDILAETGYCIGIPDSDEAPMLHSSGYDPINLTLRM